MDRHHCQRKQHLEKLSQCHKEELSDFPDADLENANLKRMRNRVVVFSSKIVAQQKKKPGNALFIRLPRLVATIRTQLTLSFFGLIHRVFPSFPYPTFMRIHPVQMVLQVFITKTLPNQGNITTLLMPSFPYNSISLSFVFQRS